MIDKSNKKKNGIKHWPEEEQPRNKLFNLGEHQLTDTELLAILLRTGNKEGLSAIDLSRNILKKFKTFRNMSHTDILQWDEFKGIGKAKIAQIRSAIEIGRRFGEEVLRNKRYKIKSSQDVYSLMMTRMRDLKIELFKAILLNSKNIVLRVIELEQGTVDMAVPIVRELFQKALQDFSTFVICVHNHPSGDPSPSKEDKDFTNKLVQAGDIMQIKVLDHIIIGENTYFSFADNNLM